MTDIPSIGYEKIIAKLRTEGWVIVGRKGNQLRLHKRRNSELFKLTVPAHRPVKKSTLEHILKLANIPPASLIV